MAGTPAYTTTVKMTGTATSMSSEAMSTNSTVSNTYQVTDATKRILARAVSVVFSEASTASTSGRANIPASDITSIDYLFGKVTFASTQAEPIKVTASYLPAAVVAGGHSYSMTMNAELPDDTDFSTTGWRSRTPGLKDVGLSISRFDSVDLNFHNLINSGSPAVVEIRPGGTGDAARGYFLIESEGRSGDVSALEVSELSFQLDESSLADFGWGTP